MTEKLRDLMHDRAAGVGRIAAQGYDMPHSGVPIGIGDLGDFRFASIDTG